MSRLVKALRYSRMLGLIGVLLSPHTYADKPTLEQLSVELESLKDHYEYLADTRQLQESYEPQISFSGFLSLRGSRSSNDNPYAANFDNIVTVEPDWNLRNGTVIGVQTVYEMNDNLSAQVQFIAKGIEDFDVRMELGFLEYKPSESSSFRIGHIRPPIYNLSEYIDVGYAYPWVTPAAEMYGIYPYSFYQGFDYRYWTSIGNWDFIINPYFGYSEGKRSLIAPKGIFAGLELRASYQNFNFRLGSTKGPLKYVDSPIEKNLKALINGVRLLPRSIPDEQNLVIPGILDSINTAILMVQLEAQVAGMAGDLNKVQLLQAEVAQLTAQKVNYPILKQDPSKKVDSQFSAAGVSYDNGDWLIMAEISEAKVDSYISNTEGGYISVAKRFGNIMPYAMWGKMRVTDGMERPNYPDLTFGNPADISQSTTPIPNQNQTVGQVYSQLMLQSQNYTKGLQQIMQFLNTNQETLTLGLRWDVLNSLAFKVQAQRVSDFGNSPGFFAPDETESGQYVLGPYVDRHEYIYQFSIDAVF